MEVVVDAYDEVERAMSWYYYLEDRLHFPFDAVCIAKRCSVLANDSLRSAVLRSQQAEGQRVPAKSRSPKHQRDFESC
jgi:hypothetical protein